MNYKLKTIYELRTKNYELGGFSLAETLIALGILAVGMVLIAGAFPVAIRLTTISAERTTATVVAEEAFAKVKLYGGRGINYNNLSQNQLKDFNTPVIFNSPAPDFSQYEFTYPTNGFNTSQKQYCWSALCRLTQSDANNNDPPVQVTVFVCRKAGPALKYYKPQNDGTVNLPPTSSDQTDWPRPVKIIGISAVNNQLTLPAAEKTFVNDDYTIVDDGSGQIYRVVKRLPAPNDYKVQLDRPWQGGTSVWVVPPPVSSGRNPCIAVYQEEIKF